MAKIVVAWFAPGNEVGELIAAVTDSTVCHVGVAIDDTYINVEPPRISLLSAVPAGASATKTLNASDQDAARGLAYMHKMDGKPYSYSIIACDLLNSLAGTHVELEKDGECVCSGTVANVLVRVGLLDTLTPDQETPASLLAKLGHD